MMGQCFICFDKDLVVGLGIRKDIGKHGKVVYVLYGEVSGLVGSGLSSHLQVMGLWLAAV